MKIDPTTAVSEMLENVAEASEFLKKLANPNRLMIVCALVDGELSDKEIGSYKPYTAAPVGAIVTINRPADEPTMLYTSGQYAPRITGAYADAAATDEWRVTDQADALRDALITHKAAVPAQAVENTRLIVGKYFEG